MIKRVLNIGVLLLVLGCNEEQTPNESKLTTTNIDVDTTFLEKDTISIDTIVVQEIPQIPDSIINSIFNLFETTIEIPFYVDSMFIDSFPEKINLTPPQVNYLSQSIIKYPNIPWSKDYTINDFYFIDSLKINDKYDNYLENEIDLGMIKESVANANYKIKVNDSIYILVWNIIDYSYEACPFSYSNVVFGTFYKNKQLYNTVVLGEQSGGGDPPYMAHTELWSQINSTGITVDYRNEFTGEVDEETDEEIIEIKKESFEVKITESDFQLVGDENN